MSKKVWIPILVSVLVAGAIFLSVGAYRVVNAAVLESRWGGRGMNGAGSEELAQALGISVDELVAAHEKASEAAISQALEQGLITEAQAGQMRSAARPGMGLHMGRGMLGAGTIDYHALLADALGITVDELNTAMQSVHQAHLAQMVASGVITQEQADQMLSGAAGFGMQGMHAGMGGFGGRGMHGGMGGRGAYGGMGGFNGTCPGATGQ